MTATLVAKNVAGGFAHRTLFEGLDLTVAPGDVVGVVGVNGAGKSTLLRILAGDVEPLEGTVSLAPADAFVGWLPQEHQRVRGETVAGYIARRTGCAAATLAMDAAAAALAAPAGVASDVDPADVYSAALDRWLVTGAADLEERLPAVLAGLGLDRDAVQPDSTPMTALSGGQAARVGLAALILSRFDIALLDEPTNDLDLDGLARLEDFVRELRGGVVLVSHDREFLARSVTRVLELDLAQNTTTVFGGGYDSYLEEREVGRRHRREQYEEFAEKKADLVARARTQREWSSQGVRNAMRKSPDNDKIRRRAATESSEKQAQKVRQMESRIARLEEVAEPRKEWALEFTIGAAPAVEFGGRDTGRSRCAPGRLRPGPGIGTGRGRRTDRHHRPQRCREIDAAAAAARSPATRRGPGEPGRQCRGRRNRSGPSGFHRTGQACRALRTAGAVLADRRCPHPAGQIRPARRPRGTRG